MKFVETTVREKWRQLNHSMDERRSWHPYSLVVTDTFGVRTLIALVQYTNFDIVPFGAAMGTGAIIGELPNSFTKRRLGISPGKTAGGPLAVGFYVWDQIDLLIGAWPLILYRISPRIDVVIASFALALIIHPLVSLIGFLVGARASVR